MKKYEIAYVDTCLPDYWSGHHLPVIQVAIWEPMTLAELKKEMKGELNLLWEHYEYQGVDFDAAVEAVDNIELKEGLGADHKLFEDIETVPKDEDGQFELDVEPCYAFFVIVDLS